MHKVSCPLSAAHLVKQLGMLSKCQSFRSYGLAQVAGTHGTVRLDDFVIPYRPDKASFLVTNNHGFTDQDLAVKTEIEERVVGIIVARAVC